jgi:ferredoxin
MPRVGEYITIDKEALEGIFDFLRESGYTIIGPTVDQETTIIYDKIEHITDLPIGWTDEQDAGTYRLKRRHDRQFFGFAVGPHSWKKYLYPAKLKLMAIERQNGSFKATAISEKSPKYAFVGVRGCELHAIQIQDKVFLGGEYQDPDYKARRRDTFIIGVECTEPGGTCFCASMGTGPRVGPGYDLRLTELQDVFVIHIGSEIGCQAMDHIDWRHTSAYDLQQARQIMTEAEQNMGRHLDRSDLPNLLYQNLDHPHWAEVAKRCLSCANCTQVCPTCFCSNVIEVSSPGDQHMERMRVWDSCFNLAFSHVHGGNIRPQTASRYRQWLTHKLASWIDQFGMSGCTGCGRCITWCPVGIDLTEEVVAIRKEK